MAALEEYVNLIAKECGFQKLLPPYPQDGPSDTIDIVRI